ncbi:MAG: c-type cytochrome domain-containing protein [Flavobacteriaceae bacterium]
MAYSSKNRWVDYIVFGLSVFLIFCLLFESYIELPNLVAWVGRLHPLILHFPIVLLLIAIFLGVTGRHIPKLLMNVAVLSALLTAISGFFLGKETPIKGDLLFWHQWLGGGVALGSAIWYGLESNHMGRTLISKGIQIVLIGGILFTGHYGGMITHGEDFLALPTSTTEEKIPDNPLIYQHVVGRILKNNCVSCHNPNKQKGQLLMTSLQELLKGGEVGNTVIPGNSESSELIRRLHLPLEDEEHMPPDGKKPLEENEIRILERWIALGASDTLRLNHLENTEPLVALVRGLMEPNMLERWKALPMVADSTIQNLTSDYLTINRVANTTDALSVSAYLPPVYDPHSLLALESVARNIVELDLSGLPIGQEEMGLVAKCKNLEWLELDRTPITDVEIDSLQSLSNLTLLKIYNTTISDQSLATFKKLKNLNRLYLWNTMMTPSALEELRSIRSNLLIDTGIDDEVTRFFVEKDSIVETP